MERPSEPLLREIVAHLPYFATIIDGDRRFVWVNQLDPSVSPDAVIGQPIDGFVHDEHRPGFVAAVEQAFETRERLYREVHAFRSREGWRWYGVQIVPMDREGEPRALLLAVDVTERREAVDAIEASEARFRAVTAALPEILTVIDREGRILETNRPTSKGTYGTSVIEYAVPEIRERVRQALRRVFDEGKADGFDARSAHDGRVYENRYLPLPPEGDEPRALASRST